MTKTTAAKITTGMKLDTNAGPAEVVNVARSQGGLFAAKDQIIVTFAIRGFERQLVLTPGQKINVIA
jgi:translation elongation factor P/translation initiation factor 5A